MIKYEARVTSTNVSVIFHDDAFSFYAPPLSPAEVDKLRKKIAAQLAQKLINLAHQDTGNFYYVRLVTKNHTTGNYELLLSVGARDTYPRFQLDPDSPAISEEDVKEVAMPTELPTTFK